MQEHNQLIAAYRYSAIFHIFGWLWQCCIYNSFAVLNTPAMVNFKLTHLMIALCCSMIANLWQGEKAGRPECLEEPVTEVAGQPENLPQHDIRYSPLDVGLW